MKTAEEVVGYIEEFYRHALARPHMYAASPQALEDVLRILDALREFITSAGATPPPSRSAYSQFLSANGYGVGTFTSRFDPQRKLTEQDRKAFQAFGQFWQAFLDSRELLRDGDGASASQQ